MTEVINPDLDLPRLQEEYRDRGRVQVKDVLAPEFAEALVQALEGLEWQFGALVNGQNELFTGRELHEMGQQKRVALFQQINQNARDNFQYAFDYYGLAVAAANDEIAHPTLKEFVEFVRKGAFFELGRAITGDERIIRADCQAMRYRPGHFLTQHDDGQVPARRAAYVLNLSRRWNADWGGLLQFYRDDQNVEEAWVPRFNMLNVFSVPRQHAVSCVAPYAGAPRLAITGWFMDA